MLSKVLLAIEEKYCHWIGNSSDRLLGTSAKLLFIDKIDFIPFHVLFPVMLPDIIWREIKLENILPLKVFEWLVILVGCMIYGKKELEARESKKKLFLLFGHSFKDSYF